MQKPGLVVELVRVFRDGPNWVTAHHVMFEHRACIRLAGLEHSTHGFA